MMNDQKVIHKPVLLKKIVQYLNIKKDGTYLDCTLGDGGYSREILQHLDSHKGKLISLDWDKESIDFVKKKFGDLCKKYDWDICHSNFADLAQVLKGKQIQEVDGIVFDLGLSSRQLENPKRGFSFKFDTSIDMRMDQSMNVNASDLIKVANQDQLGRIIREYGEERYSGRIARVIKKWVNENPNKDLSAREMVNLIRRVVPASYRKGANQPARRTFQALRIAVNDELNNLAVGVVSALSKLAKNGRLLIVSYHSLEDRIVKNAYKKAIKLGGFEKVVEGIVKADKEEIIQNPRSRSAKLRIIEKVANIKLKKLNKHFINEIYCPKKKN